MSGAVVLLVIAAVTSSALAAQPATVAPEVRRLRSRLSKVLSKPEALPAEVAAEARHLDADAAGALSAGTAEKLNEVLAEYKTFLVHLSSRQAKLRHVAAESPADAATDFVSNLEAKVKQLLTHIEADASGLTAAEASERTLLITELRNALQAGNNRNSTGINATTALVKRAEGLHKSLAAAHNYLLRRSKTLTTEQGRLEDEINEGQAKILYMMLRQRRKLPMRSQVAILRRHQFSKCRFAQKLIRSHKDNTPLYAQLEALLPSKLAAQIVDKDGQAAKVRLAAAGSDGRVLIVSSRMKNAVKNMAAQLTKARDRLKAIASGSAGERVSAGERQQATHILVGLDEMLKKVNGTADLKTQLDTLDLIESKLKSWMQGP